MMEYKGYAAEVEFDDSVGLLHGRVVNSGAYPIATFEATDVEGIRRELHRSIDEYLASRKEDGIEPRKPFSGKLNPSLPRVRVVSFISTTYVVKNPRKALQTRGNWFFAGLRRSSSASRRPGNRCRGHRGWPAAWARAGSPCAHARFARRRA